MAWDFWNSILGRQQEEKLPPVIVNDIPTQSQAFGSSGTEIFSGYLDEEYLTGLKGKERAIVFDKMRRSDAIVKMILMAIKLPILSAYHEFEIDADLEGDDLAEAEWQQKFFNQVFNEDLDKSMTGTLTEILTCNEYAYSLFEMVHKVVPAHEELGPYVGLEAFGWRSPKTIEKWNVDRNGKLLSVHQQAQGDLGRFLNIPAEFLVHFCPMMEGSDYEGVGILRPIYGAYTRKNVFLKILAAGIEKCAIPTPIGTIPMGKETAPERTLFEAVLKTFVSHQSNYMIKPEGWLIEPIELTFDAEKVRKCIDAENLEMANSILAGFLLLSGKGSNALSQDLSGFFGATVQFIADHIEEVINRKVLTSLVKLNRPNAKLMARLKIDSVKDSAEKDMPLILKTLKDGGMLTPDDVLEKYLREKYKIPAMDPATARKAQAPVDPNDPNAPKDGDEDDAKGKPKDESETPKEGEEDPEDDASPKKKQFATPSGQSKAPELIRSVEKDLKEVFADGLEKYADQLIDRMMKREDLAAASKAARDVPTAYLNKVLNVMARSYIAAQKQVEKETGTVLILCHIERGMRFADIDDLPGGIQKKLKERAQFLLQTQYSDTEKAIGLAWQANLDGATDDEMLRQDLVDARDKFLSGPVINTGPSVLSAEVVNGARLDAGKELEEDGGVESYTYVAIDDDKTTDLCLELNGHTFAVGDPDIDRYGPPQHHNCRSHYDINMKSFRDNPEVSGKLDLSKDALSQITLTDPKAPRLF